ncbi:MAG: hypothetical protein K0S07_470 [Chlamydiales bacterium]|jgi:hypothetical protein|nr:hypothetical protein [Chlamydiales bacterium]
MIYKGNKNYKELLSRIAYLEFANDQLATEIGYVDHLLRNIGFPEGLETVKVAAKELMEKEYREQRDELES